MAKSNTQPDHARPIGESHADKAEPKTAPFDEAALKAWVRREMHLASNGASPAEREMLNP